MSENPYAPPSSQVADIEGDTAALVRPLLVKVGIGLLAVELVLSLARLFIDEESLYTAVIIGVMGLITVAAWQGRNWARIVHLALLVLAVVATTVAIAVVRANPELAPGGGQMFFQPMSLAQNVLSVAGVLLLFTPAANAWYRAMKAARLGAGT